MSYNLFNFVQCEGVHQAAEVASSASDWLPLGTAVIALIGALYVNYRTIYHSKRSEIDREERALLLRISEEIQECHGKVNWFYTSYYAALKANEAEGATDKDIAEAVTKTLNEDPIIYLRSTFSALHHIEGRLHHISADKAGEALNAYIISTSLLHSEILFALKNGILTFPMKEADSCYRNVNDLRRTFLEEIKALRK